MVKTFSNTENEIILGNTKKHNLSYQRVIKSRIIDKLLNIREAFKNLVNSKLNTMRIQEILDNIGMILYPNVVKTVITNQLEREKVEKGIEEELETFLINQHAVIKKYLSSKVLNSKMKKILRTMSKDIRKKGLQ